MRQRSETLGSGHAARGSARPFPASWTPRVPLAQPRTRHPICVLRAQARLDDQQSGDTGQCPSPTRLARLARLGTVGLSPMRLTRLGTVGLSPMRLVRLPATGAIRSGQNGSRTRAAGIP